MTANVAQMLRQTAERRPQHIGLVDAGERLTWEAAYDRALHVAARLKSLGLERGQVVAISANHSLAQVIGIFGVTLADGVFTVINPLLKPEQQEHQIADAEPRIVIGTDSRLKALERVFADRRIAVVPVDRAGRLLDDGPDEPFSAAMAAIPADVACLIYTSGSTGKPKGVVVPHRTLLDGARIVSSYLNIGPEDVTLALLPFSFDYGLNQLLTATYQGARLVLHSFVLATDLFNVLASECATGLAVVPTLWPKLMDPRFATAKPELPALRYVTTAGGMHSPALLREISEFLPGVEIIVMYGLTESFRSCYLPFDQLFKRPGSIGRPVPEVEILVLDDGGAPCPAGVKGELYHRGAFVNYGYLNDPDLTALKYVNRQTGGPGCRPEAMVRSGDLVSRDDDGFIYFHGRLDTQIKSMGFRVSPSEVEEIGISVPGVAEAAAIGIPDEEFGEAVVLCYTTHSGAAVSDSTWHPTFTPQLPHYAVPRHYVHLERMPHTSTGKIDYARLKEMCEVRSGSAEVE